MNEREAEIRKISHSSSFMARGGVATACIHPSTMPSAWSFVFGYFHHLEW